MWSKFDKYLGLIENVVGCLLLISSTVVLMANVIMRYFMGSGLPWGEEFIRYTLVAAAFVGVPIAMREGSHVAMTMVPDLIRSKKWRAIYDAILLALTLAFCIYVFRTGIMQIQFLLQSQQTSAAMRIQMYIPYLFIPIGFVLTCIRVVEKAIKELRKGVAA